MVSLSATAIFADTGVGCAYRTVNAVMTAITPSEAAVSSKHIQTIEYGHEDPLPPKVWARKQLTVMISKEANFATL